jgi:diacylglycerol kinase
MGWHDIPIRLIERAGLDWFEAKTAFERSIAFGHDALHVLAGVVVQLLAAALLRRSVAQWQPWLAVLVLELLNEASDLHGEVWPDRLNQWGESAKDVALTMALPTLLLLVSRFAPRLLVRGR